MDCTFFTENGKFNYRVGAIIKNGRKLLMARNPNEKRVFYYSVGGRVKFGETAQQAIIRELKEETSLDCKIQSLYFLPGESQGQRSLVGCRLWGRTESDTTEAT